VGSCSTNHAAIERILGVGQRVDVLGLGRQRHLAKSGSAHHRASFVDQRRARDAADQRCHVVADGIRQRA
jgi:hypothetical protein